MRLRGPLTPALERTYPTGEGWLLEWRLRPALLGSRRVAAADQPLLLVELRQAVCKMFACGDAELAGMDPQRIVFVVPDGREGPADDEIAAATDAVAELLVKHHRIRGALSPRPGGARAWPGAG